MQIVVYGAGRYAEKYLPQLKTMYQIEYIMDSAPAKQGTELHGLPVVAPSKERVNRYPVLVLLYDTESGCGSLRAFGCTQTIYAIITYMGRVVVYPYVRNCTPQWLLAKSKFFFETGRSAAQVLPIVSDNAFVPGRRRCFNFASPDDFMATGGPCACLRNLHLANEQYKLIENFYTLCPGTAYIPAGAPVKQAEQGWQTVPEEDFWEPLNTCTERSERWNQLFLRLKFLWDFLDEAQAKFDFGEDDVFLTQDCLMAYVFLHRFPALRRVFIVSHAQGTFRDETKKTAPELGEVYDRMQLEQLRRVKHWIFPSQGAAAGFLRTASGAMREAAARCDFHIAYNGYEPKQALHPDAGFPEMLEEAAAGADVVFASATFLYRNKGVERIPRILADFIRRTGLRIRWFLVGGGEMELEVEDNIRAYLSPDDVVWYRTRFDNQDNIFALFQRADFYIMMHRVSVFDLSTLQSMAYGCIPVLSDVDGNLELCAFENGILVDADHGGMALNQFMDCAAWDRGKLAALQARNRDVIRERFNNKQFLEGYQKCLDLT